MADPAFAGSFQVNPVNIVLPIDRQAASLTIKNSGAAPVSVKATAYAWTQKDGRDVYSGTTNLIISPPIFTIPVGGTQLIRTGLKTRAAGAYRLIFEEIPRQTNTAGQIQVVLRLDLPVYVLPKAGGEAQLSWRAWRDQKGEIIVEGRNRGTVHAQVLELASGQAKDRKILSRQMGVILPASARHWKIGQRPDLRVGAPLLLKVRNSTGETDAQVSLEQR